MAFHDSKCKGHPCFTKKIPLPRFESGTAMAMRFSCLVFLLLWWDASTEDVIPWCLRSGSSCHGNKWTMKNVENVSHYLPNASLLAHPLRLADWDMDGDLDVVVLMEDGLWLYKMIEIGQSFSGPFELNSSTLNVNENSYLEVADFNGDGYPDVLIAEQLPSPPDRQDWCKEEGKIRYFEQWPSTLGMELNERTGSENPFNHIKIPCSDQYTNLQLVDWNADGALDLFVYSPHTMAAFLPSGAPSSIKVLYFESQDGDLVEATNRPDKSG